MRSEYNGAESTATVVGIVQWWCCRGRSWIDIVPPIARCLLTEASTD